MCFQSLRWDHLLNLEDTLATFIATIPRRALAEGLQNGLPETAGPLRLRQRVVGRVSRA